jgi:hypothetical protein
MGWLVILEIVLKLLGPILVRWLEELLEDAASEMMISEPSIEKYAMFYLELEAWIDLASRRTWWWQWRRRAVLAVVKDVVLKRAVSLQSAFRRGGESRPNLMLSVDEKKTLKRMVS